MSTVRDDDFVCGKGDLEGRDALWLYLGTHAHGYASICILRFLLKVRRSTSPN